MKRIHKLLLALLIGLLLIIGSASLFGAAPTKTPTVDVGVTKLVDQTIYYNFKFANLLTTVKSYTLVFGYEYETNSFIMLTGDVSNPIAVTLDRTKTRLGGRGSSHSIDPTYTIALGDRIIVYISLYDGIEGTGNEIGGDQIIYQVP